MEVNSKTWYARWFLWSCDVLSYFTDSEQYSRNSYQNGTNLCHFFRTILFGTLIAAVSLLTLVYAAFSIFVLPFILFPLVPFIAGVGVVIGIGVLFVAFLALALYSITFSKEYLEKLENRKREESLIEKNKDPSFFGVFYVYLKGIKEKFCPTIRFKKD
jgi:hypothetical protein